MYLTPEVRQEIFKEYGKTSVDTGSPESQVALTEHLKQNKKDLSTKRSLIALVGKRKKLLEYLKQQDIERYRELIKKLGLRK